MSSPTGPVTLGDLIREDKLLWVYCRECCHERDVDPLSLRLPPRRASVIVAGAGSSIRSPGNAHSLLVGCGVVSPGTIVRAAEAYGRLSRAAARWLTVCRSQQHRFHGSTSPHELAGYQHN